MSFNASIPQATDSPSIFPAQAQTNWTRFQTIVEADHQFNISATANDGYHNLVHLTPQSPSGVLAGAGRLYVKTAGTYLQQFYMDDNGREYQVTPGIIAAVNFNGTGAVGNQVLRSALNVTSVNRTGTGKYTVTFTTAIANDSYIVSFTGMRADTASGALCCVKGDPTYSNAVTTGTLLLETYGTGDNYQNVLMGNLLVYSIS